MICVIGMKDTVTGLGLAGIKKSYGSPKDIDDEKVIIIDNQSAKIYERELAELEEKGKIVIRIKAHEE